VARFEGQVSVFAAPHGPCYRCLFPEMPAPGTVPNCAEDGVLGVLPGIIGLHQAAEVIKWLTGLGQLLVGRLLMFDLLDHSTNEVELVRDPACMVCGAGSRPAPPVSDASSRSSPEMTTAPEIDVSVVAERLRSGDDIVLLDVRESWEYEIGRLPGAMLVPLSTLPNALASLDSTREYVVYCHHGMRSAIGGNWLVSQGFQRVHNMTGGIDAWSLMVDPSVAQY
jgi:adenylyltransferase/sulfurtransferase